MSTRLCVWQTIVFKSYKGTKQLKKIGDINMEKKISFIGVDVSLEESLFEYGLLVEDTTDAEKYVIIRYGENCYIQTWFDFNYIPELLEEDYMKKDTPSFLSFLSCNSLQDFLQQDDVCKLYDLISYFGIDNIIGSLYGAKTFTTEEVKEYLNI